MDRCEQEREALLDAALQQWADGGWTAVDPREAVRRSGVPASCAAEFTSGAELVCAVFDHIVDERSANMLQSFAEAAAAGSSPIDRFRVMTTVMLDDVVRDPRRAVVLADAVGCAPLVARRRSANRGFAEIVASQPVGDGVEPDDLRLAGHFVIGGLAEIVLACVDPDSPVDRERAIEHGAKLLEACATTR